MNSQIVARELRIVGGFESNQYKKSAFFRAASNIERVGEKLKEFYPDKFENIEGVGKSIAKLLIEMFDKGSSLRGDIAKLELERKGMIKHKKGGDVLKRKLSDAMVIVNEMTDYLREFKEVKFVRVAGSIRRGKEFVADADFVAVVDPADREYVSKKFVEDGKNPSYGSETASAVFNEDFQIDLNYCTESEFGCHLLHSTGSKEHNIKMRSIAKNKGYKLNQRCLENVNTGEKHYFKMERDVFDFLGIEYVEPERR